MSAYTSLGGGRRSKSSSNRRSVADYEAEVRREQRIERLDDVQRLHDELVLHLLAHREEFPPIAKPTVTPATINLEARIEHARRDAVENISAVKVGRRRAAREAAEAMARKQAHMDQDLENQRAAEEQAIVDAVWNRLLGNDPTTVLATIEDAFADNEVPAAPIDSDGDAVTLLMRFPSVDGVVPTHAPDETPTGRRTMREYSKTERNALHVGAMLSHAYATVAEAFAVAPGIQSTTLLVVASDASSLTPVYAAQVDRPAFESGAWLQDSVAVFAPGHLINLRGRTQELAPLSLEHEPELSAVVERLAVDLELAINPATRLATGAPDGSAMSPATTESPVEVTSAPRADGDTADPESRSATRAEIELPRRITQSWLTANVPPMPESAYIQLVELLRGRGWTDSEIAERVALLRRR